MQQREVEFFPQAFLEEFAEKTGVGFEYLYREFESVRRYGVRTRRAQLDAGKRPHSSLYHLANFWLAVLVSMHQDGFGYIARREKKENLSLELWDMRAAAILRERWAEYRGCIFCSGTLQPIKGFSETIGLQNYKGRSFLPQYSEAQVLALITEELTTKGERLRRAMATRYLEAIGSFIKGLNANLAIFSASYRVQNALLNAGLKRMIEELGRKFFMERQGMRGDAARKVLDYFKFCAYEDEKGVLCATATGRFAEGADFPGCELEGIFLVGIPFDQLTIKTRLYVEYYKRLYGVDKGTYYAYIVPALRRAAQALGRALRSLEDCAAFVCADFRYADPRFRKLLPSFIARRAKLIPPEDIVLEVERWHKKRR